MNPADSKHSLWTEQYKPTTSTELSCGQKTINIISKWISEWHTVRSNALDVLSKRTSKRKSKTEDTIPPSCMLLTGPTGVGKTTAVKIIIQECGFRLVKLNLNDIKGTKGLESKIKSIKSVSNISDIFDNKEQKKPIIVIDGLENILTNTDKSNIKLLRKENDSKWHFPIIFISNEQHNKLLAEFVKICFRVKMFTPFESTLFSIMDRIMRSESMKIDSKESAKLIIEHSQYNIRRLILTLQELAKIYGKKRITSTDVLDYCNMSKKKDSDTGLFDATKHLLYNYTDIETCMNYFNTEKKGLLSLVVQENYLSAISNLYSEPDSKLTQLQCLETMMLMSEAISKGDISENSIYACQLWNILSVYGYNTCVETSYYMSKLGKKENVDDLFLPCKFPSDLNRTNIKNINKKNISNTGSCFENFNITDCIHTNKILKILITNNDIKSCVRLLQGYNVKLENIKSLLKIDKITKSDNVKIKNSLTSKQEKIFNQLLSHHSSSTS